MFAGNFQPFDFPGILDIVDFLWRSKIFQKLYGLINKIIWTEKVWRNQNFLTDVKNVENFRNFWLKNSLFWTVKKSICRTKTKTKNVPEFSDFFLQMAVHFCENVPNFVTLTGTHGLTQQQKSENKEKQSLVG